MEGHTVVEKYSKSLVLQHTSEASNFIFVAYSPMTFALFWAVKTMLSKVENLWYLRRKVKSMLSIKI